ncbi:ATP-binding protein [Kamptonema animale CS-326]|jgi:signal transduction histidine kinase|uniref:ATP-binding protein n=1 Tax=Kamptonema animale TaxID=92934 RepID=UPI00232CD751|nr:ATP-binding protein [Kamptonema animale]MDB9512227.1 ATP-binding protein [Kamptonema animale CS-326]
MKGSFFVSLRFQMTVGVMVGVVPAMLVAIWFASDRAAEIIRTQAKQHLELKADVLTESVSRWEQMNVRVLYSLSHNPNTISMDVSQQLPLVTAINRTYNHIYAAETYNLEGYVISRGNGQPLDRIYRGHRHWFKNAIAGHEITREAVISHSTGKPAMIFSTPIREFTNIYPGNRSLSVKELQEQLKTLEYYKGLITGNYDRATAEAVSQFQKAYPGLPDNGTVNLTTKQLLDLATHSPQEDSVDEVQKLVLSEKLFSTPVNARAKTKGVAIIGTFLSDLAHVVGAVRLGKTGFAFLVDENGSVLAHPDPNFVSGDHLTNLSNYPAVKTLLNGQTGTFSFTDDKGVKWLSYGKKLDIGWGVIILQQEHEALENEKLFLKLAIAIAVIAVLGVGGLTWILTSRIIQPITHLTVAAESLCSGEWNQRVNINRKDELGILAKAFNQMAWELQALFTNLQSKNEEAQKARTEAEEASKAKSLFLANMSHELRTPLNAIIGYSDMLAEEFLDIEFDNFIPDLQKINSAGKHLLLLVNNILNVSNIESGQIQLDLELFNIETIVNDVVNTLQPLAEKRANILTVNCPEDIGTMYGDVIKTHQCLFSLLSNASKFTEGGYVNLDVYRHRNNHQEESEIMSGEEWVIFKISDTGIGMSPEQIGKVFQAFTQADESATRRYDGSGLGLAITKKFCQMMGGDIRVESKLGKGSIFTIKLPATIR